MKAILGSLVGIIISSCCYQSYKHSVIVILDSRVVHRVLFLSGMTLARVVNYDQD